jgi:hypothetical protein
MSNFARLLLKGRRWMIPLVEPPVESVAEAKTKQHQVPGKVPAGPPKRGGGFSYVHEFETQRRCWWALGLRLNSKTP